MMTALGCVSGCMVLGVGSPARYRGDAVYYNDTHSKAARIRILGDLKKDGLISEEEFAKEKKKILEEDEKTSVISTENN